MTSNKMIGVLSLVLCGAALFSISYWADDLGPADRGHGEGAGAQESPTPADSGHAMLVAPKSRVSERLDTAQDHPSVAPDSVLGQVNITVRTQDGLVVDKGTVVLNLNGRLVQEEHLDDHGECVFSALEPGEYSPVILQDSLEYGLLAPRDQERYEEYLHLYMRGQLTEALCVNVDETWTTGTATTDSRGIHLLERVGRQPELPPMVGPQVNGISHEVDSAGTAEVGVEVAVTVSVMWAVETWGNLVRP